MLVAVMNGQGGRNAVARVNAAMRILDLSGALDEPKQSDVDQRSVAQLSPDERDAAAQRLVELRKLQKLGASQ